jgi:uncharacterized protein YacL
MNISLAFTRLFFLILSIFFMTSYMISIHTGSLLTHLLIGLGMGLVFTSILIVFDSLFKRFNLRSFNIALIGIFIGYLMGKGLVLILEAVLEISAASFVLHPQVLEVMKISLFLFGTYLGTIMTIRASDELYVSIPFVKFTPMAQKKKDILIDGSTLGDSRIIDLANSGLLDQHLIIPRFIMKELYAEAETGDEATKSKARRSLETIKKLEELPILNLRYNDTDFPEVKDQLNKLIRLARLIDANILTADISRVQIATIEGVRIINLHTLSNALKPLMQAGEKLSIKIQRYGKEPRQGVGYLDDGTMVVVNGGGDYIGEIIEVQVLSVKHTASGRMIFCNTIENGEFPQEGFENEEY